jgi:hypothetical protein
VVVSDLILDPSRVLAEGEDLAKQMKQLVARFEREKGWPPERTAQALLAIVYGFCSRAGFSREEALMRANEQFSAIDRELANARKRASNH